MQVNRETTADEEEEGERKSKQQEQIYTDVVISCEIPMNPYLMAREQAARERDAELGSQLICSRFLYFLIFL